MRACAYLRVSSLDQRVRASIDSQRRDVPAWIASQGWSLVATYEDDGRSAAAGKLEARTGYARMLSDCRAGLVDVVVVAAVDRLTRSEDPVERARVVADLTATGARIAVVGAGIQDPGTFAGDAYLSLQGLFAAEWLRRHKERVIAGQITAASRGRKPRGTTPYGLRYDRATGAWSTDPSEAAIVREVYERIAAGERVHRIADDLDQRGVPRPGVGRWDSPNVYSLVRSEVYTGRFVTDRERGLAVPVPPIVDADLADMARGALLGRYRRPEPRLRHHPLLAGLAVCGMCRARIGVGDTARAPVRGIRVYRCLHRRRPPAGKPHCEMPLIRAEPLDQWVWDAVIDVLADDAVLDRAMAQRQHGEPTADPAAHRAELERIDAAQAAVLAQLADGVIGQATADDAVRRLATRRRSAQEALSAALAASRGLRAAAASDALSAAVERFRRGVATFSPAERRGLLHAAVAAAVLHPDLVAIDLHIDARSLAVPGRPAGKWDALPVRLPTMRIATPRAA
jgi:site-specific DNA recombinase